MSWYQSLCHQGHNNMVAAVGITENLTPHSRLKNWKPVNLDEMKVFLSLVLVMNLVQKDDIEKYWSTGDIDETPYFWKQISGHYE